MYAVTLDLYLWTEDEILVVGSRGDPRTVRWGMGSRLVQTWYHESLTIG